GQFISEKKAADIKKNLSDVSADAINQFRLRFSRLEAFQRTVGGDGQPREEVTTGLFRTFSFRIRDVAGAEEEVLDRTYVDRISEATPQRFDLPVSSPVVRGIATDLLAGKAVSLDMIVTTFVAQEDLYRVRIEGAGIRVKAQPELVISALDSVGSQL
ncbi:MAG: hypothetical protein FJ087_21130, partial [Deltaproteobacteria bacterium]|nr:hypothetical protein [Deltaproteobacteria bacterium]